MTSNHTTIGESICTLLEQARQGSTEAQSNLLGQLQTYLTLVAEKHVDPQLRPKLAASDLVQQSLTIAVERFDQFRGQSEGELYAWITTIIKNELKQQRRAFHTSKRNIKRERDIEFDSKLNEHGINLADRMPTPATHAVNLEQSRSLALALSSLPEELQQVIVLRNWEHLTFREIADRMQKTESAVTRIWYRALVGLQTEMDRRNGG